MPETGLVSIPPEEAVLVTESLLLRVLTEGDLDAFSHLISQDGLIGFSPLPELSPEALLSRYVLNHYRALVRGDDGAIVGFIGINGDALAGYDRFFGMKLELFLVQEEDEDYVSEAIRAFLVYVFDYVRPDMVWAELVNEHPAFVHALSEAEFFYVDCREEGAPRYVCFNKKPTKLREGKREAVIPSKIILPEQEASVNPEEPELEVLVDTILVEEAEAEPEPVEAVEEPAPIDEEASAEALEDLVYEVVGEEGQVVAEAKEEKPMPELEPINIEITEDQTVEMEINGVTTVLYEGKKRPAPAKKPQPKAKPKPAAKPAAKPAPKAPARKAAAPIKTEERRPLPRLVNPRNKERLDPTRELVDYGPGTSDDGQRSIHTVAFEDKMKAAPKDIRDMYHELSAYLGDVYGCSHRVSFGYDSFRINKKVVVALSLGGVHLRVNTCLDPKFYDGTKMRVNDDSASKQYKDLPSCIKIISEKNFKQSFRLIDDTMKSLGVKRVKK